MLTLGEVLALSRRSAASFDRLRLPPELASALETAAAAEGVDARAFLRIAVADFANAAGPGDWTRLMSKLRDSADPGSDCLTVMLERRLAESRRRQLAED
jgi:hypothetical protein